MVRLAKRLNRHGERAVYVENRTDDLSLLQTGSVDFLYSDVVLQHIQPKLATRCVAEFLRILRVGGIAVFQMASHPRPEAARVVQPSAMSDDAYSVRFEVSNPPTTLTAGASATLSLLVTNTSGRTWPSSVGQIRIGNHWLDGATGAMLVQDDGRVALPTELAPGSPLRVALTINAPKTPGAYICEIDAVREGITWFADRGSDPVRLAMVVSGTSDSADAMGRSTKAQNPVDPLPDIYAELPPDATEPGDFPMFGVPHEMVREVVEAHGGRIFLQEPDERCGPEWIGFRFFVEKQGSEATNPGL